MGRRSVILLCTLGLAIGGGGAAWAAFAGGTQNSGNSFTAASSFCTGSAYTPLWLAGFEEGVGAAAGYDAGVGAAIDATTQRSGSYSLQLAATGGGAYAAKAAGTAASTLRFAVRFPSLPSGDVTSIAGFTVSAGNGLSMGYRASDQKLVLRWGSGAGEASSVTVSAGTWYVIDLRANLSANPRTGDWRIDGVSQTSVSSAEAAATVSYVGLGSNLTTDLFTANYDDVLTTTSAADYPVGPGRVLALPPDGVLTHSGETNFQEEDGTAIDASSWNRLDEAPMDSTADAVQQKTASGTSYLAFSFSDPSATCIKAVSATVAYRSPGGGGGPNNGKASIFDGSTERTIYSGDMKNTALAYRSAAFAPAEVSAWTQSAVSALSARVGYSTDVAPRPGWEAVQLSYEAQ